MKQCSMQRKIQETLGNNKQRVLTSKDEERIMNAHGYVYDTDAYIKKIPLPAEDYLAVVIKLIPDFSHIWVNIGVTQRSDKLLVQEYFDVLKTDETLTTFLEGRMDTVETDIVSFGKHFFE